MRALLIALALALAAAPALSENAFEPASDGIYNYCPAAFTEDGVKHVFYCTNTRPLDVVDSIGYRTAVLEDGEWVYSQESIVLEHTKSWIGWDTTHACDPDVIKGEFRYAGEEYCYLMAYLGCDTGNNQENEIGLAVAKAPGGPYIKTESLNPFVAFERDRSTLALDKMFQWGVGQPSLVSLDKAGRVMLIYTSGKTEGTYLYFEKWDLRDMDSPTLIERARITNAGSVGRDMLPATICNADAAYDPATGLIYLAADALPCYIEGCDEPGQPTFISTQIRLMRFSVKYPDPAEAFSGEGEWETLALVGPKETGFPRNHNCSITADEYGWLAPGADIEIMYSVSQVREPSNSLWTYRIRSASIER